MLLIVLIAAAYTSRRFDYALPGTREVPALSVHFLDVGQGDAVLIRTADGGAVLYDGGDGAPSIVPLLERFDVRSLELVIASHNHADHIGGLVDVIKRYRPRFVMENGVQHTTRTYERFLLAIVAASAQRLLPTRRTIRLGDVQLHVLPPRGDSVAGHNENSIGIIVQLADFRVSLLGDSDQELQSWWLETHADLLGGVTVHKASHHGSDSGDAWAMLERLEPGIVVIGVGAGNGYGHPHPRALGYYSAIGARVYRTDRHGTVSIVVENDGHVDVRSERTPLVNSRAPDAAVMKN